MISSVAKYLSPSSQPGFSQDDASEASHVDLEEFEDAYEEAGHEDRRLTEEMEKLSVSSQSTHSHQSSTTKYTGSQKYNSASESASGPRRDAKSSSGSGQAKYKRVEPPQQSGFSYDFLRGDYRLQEIERRIFATKVDLADLQQFYEERSTVLLTTRHELKSVQAQLDSVQHFISTADAHADQDIVQKLHELNEEVYQLSMTMADRVVESFTRQNTTENQKKELFSVEQNVLIAVGQVMMDHLAAVHSDEDVALFLQIAFQGYLSFLLYHVVSLWTNDQQLNSFVSDTYNRLQKAESQSIYGHWRSLTRTYIQPTPATEPEALVQIGITGLSNIVLATGLSPSGGEIPSKLSSEFSEGVQSIISHAGKFGDMISGMISGNFELFTVRPGTAFDSEQMIDINGDGSESQTVLCVSRVGLRKRTGGRGVMLSEAHVALESFLG